MVPMKTRMMPHSPGTMITAVRRSGLKRTSVSAVPMTARASCAAAGSGAASSADPAAPGDEPAPSASCRPPAIAWAAETRRSAAWAAKSSDPSISTVAASPAGRRGHEGDDRLAAAQRLLRGRTVVARPHGDDLELLGQPRFDQLRRVPHDHGGDLLHVEARRVAEDDEEEERQEEEHGDRPPVTPQLPELLDDDRPHAHLPVVGARPEVRAPINSTLVELYRR